MKKSKKVKIAIRTIKIGLTLLVVVMLGAVILQRLSNNKINFFGHSIYTIITTSMVPEYEVGDMFIAKKVPLEDIEVGDDIVYLGEVDDYKDKVITHRVVKIDNKIHTKGINNDLEDPAISYDQVYGKVVTKLFLLSTFSKIMNNNVVFYIVIFVPLTLLVFLDIRGIVEDKEALEKEKNKDVSEEQKEIFLEEMDEIREELQEEQEAEENKENKE